MIRRHCLLRLIAAFFRREETFAPEKLPTTDSFRVRMESAWVAAVAVVWMGGSVMTELSSAFDSTMGILRKVGRDDLGSPTPCAAWDVRALVNHFIGSGRWWASMVSGDDGLEAPEGADYVAGDFVAAYEESIRVTLSAFGAEGAGDRMVRVPFGEFAGSALRGFAALDQFTHGWDLARALGYDTDLAPGLASVLLALAEVAVDDSLRGADGEAPFGAARRAPEGSCAADRLAAYLGREV